MVQLPERRRVIEKKISVPKKRTELAKTCNLESEKEFFFISAYGFR